MSNRIQDTQGSNQTRKVLESSAFTHGGAYQSLISLRQKRLPTAKLSAHCTHSRQCTKHSGKLSVMRW